MTPATRQRAIGHAHSNQAARPADLAAGMSRSREKALYRVTEAMALLSMSRTVIYELMRAGRLHYVTEGSARRITDDAITAYVALLETEMTRRTA